MLDFFFSRSFRVVTPIVIFYFLKQKFGPGSREWESVDGGGEKNLTESLRRWCEEKLKKKQQTTIPPYRLGL